MSQIGNDDILRSYPRNRYRDHHMLATQLEYRFPLFWRIGLTTSAGLGDVFSKAEDITWNNTKYALGLGFRFLANTAERLNLRVDYSIGSQGGFFYVSFAEAF